MFTAAGTVLLVAGILTALVYRVSPGRALRSLGKVIVEFRFTILTVVAVLALAYVMNFSGQTVTLGPALAETGGCSPSSPRRSAGSASPSPGRTPRRTRCSACSR